MTPLHRHPLVLATLAATVVALPSCDDKPAAADPDAAAKAKGDKSGAAKDGAGKNGAGKDDADKDAGKDAASNDKAPAKADGADAGKAGDPPDQGDAKDPAAAKPDGELEDAAEPAGGEAEGGGEAVPGEAEIERPDLLTFANGAFPVSVGEAARADGADWQHSVANVDGSPVPRTVTNSEIATATAEFVYALPAPTTFDRLAVPEVGEVPSPTQTFFGKVEVLGGSAAGGPFELLASGELSTHDKRGMVTELTMSPPRAVTFVKLRLTGAIDQGKPKQWLEFSEIIGNGEQEAAKPVDHFTGMWKDKFLFTELRQEGSVVTGCYDAKAELSGTVTGNLLRARGVNPDDGVISLFILGLAEDGTLRGVRSTNGGPFKFVSAGHAPKGSALKCKPPETPGLGCDSVVHGINFGFDSADIRPDSEPVLAALYDGLESDASAKITIEGHTSSEGSDGYNQKLSERRAQAVVDDLVKRGLDKSRISAVGKGEAEPIAKNTDESGRALNRRVEVECG